MYEPFGRLFTDAAQFIGEHPILATVTAIATTVAFILLAQYDTLPCPPLSACDR